MASPRGEFISTSGEKLAGMGEVITGKDQLINGNIRQKTRPENRFNDITYELLPLWESVIYEHNRAQAFFFCFFLFYIYRFGVFGDEN